MSLSSETGNLNRECAVAATMFEGAKTAHSLFKFPVFDENESDLENPNVCNLKNTDRLELPKETSVIFWDEFPNHKEMFESVMIALEDSRKLSLYAVVTLGKYCLLFEICARYYKCNDFLLYPFINVILFSLTLCWF